MHGNKPGTDHQHAKDRAHADDPRDRTHVFPEKQSIGSVWILLIMTWNPAKTTAIAKTANNGAAANAAMTNPGKVTAPPNKIARFRANSIRPSRK